MKKYRAFLSFCLIALVVWPGISGARAGQIEELNRIVAVVDDDVITDHELEQRLRSIKRQLRDRNTRMPPDDILRRQVLERLVIERLQLNLAMRTGIRVDDEALNRVITNIAKQNALTLPQFRNVLERDGYDFADFREEIRNEVIISRLRARHVENQVTITPQEIDIFLESQAAQSANDTQYHLSHILIAVREAAGPEDVQRAKAKATRVLEELRNGADFAQIAVTHSDGQQALEGGDLGWRKAGQLPTLFSDVVMGMSKGQVSDLIRSPSGFHIIKLNDKKDGEKHVVRQVHARHILIRTSAVVSDAEAKSQLDELRRRILNGEDFATLAQAHSQDPGSAAQGGDLGWAGPGTYVPAFEKAIAQLAEGEISEPFESRFGWHIVQLLGTRSHDSTDEYRRTKAQEALRARKTEEEAENWLRRLRDEAYVEYRLDY